MLTRITSMIERVDISDVRIIAVSVFVTVGLSAGDQHEHGLSDGPRAPSDARTNRQHGPDTGGPARHGEGGGTPARHGGDISE